MKRILFVCVENSCRSQMAEGFARKLGQGKIEAHSAGSKPSGRVDSGAAQVMQEKGIDLKKQSSKGLKDLPSFEWDAVITMGCGDSCPHLTARRRVDWDLPDPKGTPIQEMRRVRDEIESRVKRLLQELEKSSIE